MASDIFIDQLAKTHPLSTDEIVDKAKRSGNIRTSLFGTNMIINEVLLFAMVYKFMSNANASFKEAEIKMESLLTCDWQRLEEEYVFMRFIKGTNIILPLVIHKDALERVPEDEIKIASSGRLRE